MPLAARVNLDPASCSDATHATGTIVGLELGLEAPCRVVCLVHQIRDPLAIVGMNAFQKRRHRDARRGTLLVEAEQVGQSPRHRDGLCGEVRFPEADIAGGGQGRLQGRRHGRSPRLFSFKQRNLRVQRAAISIRSPGTVAQKRDEVMVAIDVFTIAPTVPLLAGLRPLSSIPPVDHKHQCRHLQA